MKNFRYIVADEGKVVSVDNKNYGKVIFCNWESTYNVSEITDEEYDGLKNQYDGSGEQFYSGIVVRPNQYYFYNEHRYVYMGERKTANSWEEVADMMAEFDE